MSEDQTQDMPAVSGHAKSNLGIPIAIVLAAALIAAAIFFSGQGTAPAENNTTGTNQQNAQVTPEFDVAPVTEDDHIRGNPNAPIVVVEYSDFDCPFCKQFHETMNRIMSEYGTEGQVAWVYRQFPIEQLHPNAPKIAAASECVAELGGNDAFWTFADEVFEKRGTNELTDITKLTDFAVTSGVDANAFTACLEDGRYDQQISDAVMAAQAAGARGTPHSIILVGDQQGVINGAQPYTTVKQIIDQLLVQIQGGETGTGE